MQQERDSAPQRQKLSIYSDPPTDVILLDTPSALETHIGTARRAATAQLRGAHAHVQGLVSRWVGIEHSVELRLHSLLAPSERLLPGTLYAGIALLSGLILTRSRALPIRAVLPPAFAVGAFAHFLPETSANIRAYASDLEDAHLPEVARVHEVGKAHTGMAWARVREAAVDGREKAREGVLKALEGVQGATGLRLREAIGVAREMEKKAEAVVEEKIRDLEGVVDVAEQKVEDAAKDRLV